MNIWGIHLVGFTAENGRKLVFTVCFLAAIIIGGRVLRWLAEHAVPGERIGRVRFWTAQVIRVLTTVAAIVAFVSVWFDDPSRLATAAGLVTAGIAFAMQRVFTSLAAYLILLRGKSFSVGDRITMGGVRGDVIALDLMQTTIMEMGQPPGEQQDAPSMWVHARQYTGRVVTVTNDKIFEQPVYNYSRDLPYVWEEMRIPIAYRDDRSRVERILLEVAEHHTVRFREMSAADLAAMERRYAMRRAELGPRVFWRMTDNWVELAVRFIAPVDDVRALKDRMTRDILAKLDEAGIGIASGTYEIVGFPPVRIETPALPELHRSR
jgi:small-conductance mechanosensitive channel